MINQKVTLIIKYHLFRYFKVELLFYILNGQTCIICMYSADVSWVSISTHMPLPPDFSATVGDQVLTNQF